MLSKVLVPLDGSKLSDRILAQVERLLVRDDAEVMLLRSVTEPISVPATPAQRRLIDAAQQHLEGARDALVARGARASGSLLLGTDAAGKILAFARRYRPSLIAMSTHGRSGVRRWIRGSVAERVLRHSPFPVLLWNPFRAGAPKPGIPRFRKILLPLDGSETSARILPLVGAFARLNGARVILFHTQVLYPTVGDYAGFVLPPDPKSSRRILEGYRKRLPGVKTSIRAALGLPAEAILEAAEREKVDLVALATHGRTGLSRWALGSVAEQVLRHCPLPVLVQRTGGPAV